MVPISCISNYFESKFLSSKSEKSTVPFLAVLTWKIKNCTHNTDLLFLLKNIVIWCCIHKMQENALFYACTVNIQVTEQSSQQILLVLSCCDNFQIQLSTYKVNAKQKTMSFIWSFIHVLSSRNKIWWHLDNTKQKSVFIYLINFVFIEIQTFVYLLGLMNCLSQ